MEKVGLVVYDSVSYGMVDNLGRPDEWLGIYWLGSGEVRWASGNQHDRTRKALLQSMIPYYQLLGTLRSPSLSTIQQNELSWELTILLETYPGAIV